MRDSSVFLGLGATIFALAYGFYGIEMVSDQNFRIQKDLMGNYTGKIVTPGIDFVGSGITDEYSLRYEMKKIEDAQPKDKNGIFLQDLDLNIVVKNVPGPDIINFLKTYGLESKESNGKMIGISAVEKEARSLIQEVMKGFDCENLATEQNKFEKTFQEALQKKLDTMYGKVFEIGEVKIASFKLSEAVQSKIDQISAIKTEEAKAQAREKVLAAQLGILEKDVQGVKKIAQENGVAFEAVTQLMAIRASADSGSKPTQTISITSGSKKP